MSTQVIHQFNGKMTYKGQRIYIDKVILGKAGFTPGTKFQTITNPKEHIVEFLVDENGSNKVSHKPKKDGIIPVIDRQGSDIREALNQCDEIKITFIQDRVIIEGVKRTASVLSEMKPTSNNLTTISFCAGAGISSECMKKAGFQEVAAVEWNPKEGSEDKFSEIYLENHPDSVMFNIPMQQLRACDLPVADVWVATLDCTDYSKASNGTKKEFHTMHLFMHLMRLFWEKPKTERPLAILIENVAEFEKVAGISLELCFKEEGYHVSRVKLNSLEYGSRTKRERFFMVASVYEGFLFPEKSGVNQTPIEEAGIISIDELEWVTPEESGTLQYFLNRETKGISHNHYMTLFDITKDTYIGTITKNHHKIQPENWIKHPSIPNLYAYLKGEHVRALHDIDKGYYLGNSNKMIVECIGQSVCTQTFIAIADSLYHFIREHRKTYSEMSKTA
jgi:DNA (cytosine-5)-methyltransferase 1